MKKIIKRAAAYAAALLVVMLSAVSAFSAGGFSDVSETSWAYPYIKKAAEAGIISGYTDGSFKPLKDVSRQESIVMLHRTAKSLGLTDEQEAANSPDQALGIASWALENAAYAIEKGIASEKDFAEGAAAAAPRQQIAVWAAGYMGYELSPLSVLLYSDTSYIEPEYFPHIDALYRHGIMQGNAGRFNPLSGVLRQELAAVTVRMLEDSSGAWGRSLDDDYILEYGKLTLVNSNRNTLVLTKGDTTLTLYISPDAQLVIDGKASDFSELEAFTGRNLSFSALIGSGNSVLVQTGPSVMTGTVVSVNDRGDYQCAEIKHDGGAAAFYALSENGNIPAFAPGSSIKFISDGALILEAK